MLPRAKWISHSADTEFVCPVFKKEFTLKKPLRRATLTATARGYYYATLNGERVGEFIFAPGCTSPRRVQVQTYDVTSLLAEENTLTVTLSRGWFRGRIANTRPQREYPDKREMLIAELLVEYADGKREYIVTDESWQSAESRVRFADFYDGEHYDATYTPTYGAVELATESKRIIVPQQGEIVKEAERVKPVRIFKTPCGETVLDFGVNMAGYPEVTVEANAGERVALSFAEVLDKDGNFYNENFRSAKAEFVYICKDGKQTYKPRFTFYGFRYIRVDAFPSEVTEESITAIKLYSDMRRTGHLESGSPLLNRFFDNVLRSQQSNFIDIPTDCPQRDERLGWTGDAQVFIRTASYNYDVERFFTKWLSDYAYGSVMDWVYSVACGIQPVEEAPGYREVVIAPHPTDRLPYLSATLETRNGRIRSAWYREDGGFRYEIETPVPATVRIDGKEYKLEKGSYSF